MKYLNRPLLFVLGAAVHWAWSSHFPIFGLAPQVLLVLAVALASGPDPILGQNFAFFWGLFLDVMGVHAFGANALAFTLIAYLVSAVRRQMDISSPLSQSMIVGVISLSYYVFLGLVGFVFEREFYWVGWGTFCFAPLFNCLIAPFCFYAVENLIQA